MLMGPQLLGFGMHHFLTHVYRGQSSVTEVQNFYDPSPH